METAPCLNGETGAWIGLHRGARGMILSQRHRTALQGVRFLVALDLDNTVWGPPDDQPDIVRCGPRCKCEFEVTIPAGFRLPGDLLKGARLVLGSKDEHGKPISEQWARQAKDEGTMSMIEFFSRSIHDVLTNLRRTTPRPFQHLLEFSVRTVQPRPWVREFFQCLLRARGLPVFITNGGDRLSGAVFRYFFGDIIANPIIIANRFEGRKLRGLYDEGVRKDAVVQSLHQIVPVVAYGGDSGDHRYGDVAPARWVYEQGGLVLCLGGQEKGTLWHAFDGDAQESDQIHYLEDFRNARSIMERVGILAA